MRLSELLRQAAAAEGFAWHDVRSHAGARLSDVFVAASGDPGGQAITRPDGTLTFLHGASAWSGPDPHAGETP